MVTDYVLGRVVLTKGDVKVDDVAVLERTLVGDTVADDLVDRCADRLGEL